MFGTTRGTLVPARKHLFAVTLAVIASVPVAARADYTADTMVDVRTLPRPEGAVEKTAETKTHHDKTYRLTYDVPASVAVTAAAAATKKSLAADGWVEYARPLENDTSSSAFKKGRQGLNVSVWQGKPNQSCPIIATSQFMRTCRSRQVLSTSSTTSGGPISAASPRPGSTQRSTSSARRWKRSAGGRSKPRRRPSAGRTRSSARRSRTACAPITAMMPRMAFISSGRSC